VQIINVRNVHEALWQGLRAIHALGVRRESRNGPVLQFPTPVCTVYQNPMQRVVFWPERECNPYLHFFESMWMLAGRNDIKYLMQFTKQFAQYSDDGTTMAGAYGFRWQSYFDFNQLLLIIDALRKNHDDRRQVLTMWSPSDLINQENKKDIPCNLQAIFSVTAQGALDMMVTNRSNDMLWGAYGANAVHFSYLHEFIAAACGLGVGIYRQVSNNLHVYTDTEVYKRSEPIRAQPYSNPYSKASCTPKYIFLGGQPPMEFIDELKLVLELLDKGSTIGSGHNAFIRRVVYPFWLSWEQFRAKTNSDRYVDAIKQMSNCEDRAWYLAVWEYCSRRQSLQLVHGVK
jgi:ribulose bisphosphate carboxylase small subunit